MRELAPRPISGLGATALGQRPEWCPPARVPQDVCEIQYSVDVPIVGRTDVGLPVYRITYDMMQAVSEFLPERLPEWYAAAQPYIAQMKDDMVRTIEYEADYLADEMLEKKVNPMVERVMGDAEIKVRNVANEIMVTTAALSAAVIVSVGVAAWWIRSKG